MALRLRNRAHYLPRLFQMCEGTNAWVFGMSVRAGANKFGPLLRIIASSFVV